MSKFPLLGFFFCLVKSYFSSDYRDLLEKLILINKVKQIVQSKTLQIYSKNDIKEQLGALHVYVPWPLMCLYYTFTKRKKMMTKIVYNLFFPVFWSYFKGPVDINNRWILFFVDRPVRKHSTHIETSS